MDDQKEEVKLSGRELNKEEAQKLKEGVDIRETIATAGWKVIEGWLKARAFHSWVDPRGMGKDDWEWAELNAFHSHDVANQILMDIAEAIGTASELENIKIGKDQPKEMKI